MKRLLTIVLCAVIVLALPVIARAENSEVDLSGMTYDELVALKDKINLAIWESEEWQEVEVPQGVWEVGEDIPEGKWTIKATKGQSVLVAMGTEVQNGGTEVKTKAYEIIYSPDYDYYEKDRDSTEWTIELSSGIYIEVSGGTAIFTPYAGKQDLGFKK